VQQAFLQLLRGTRNHNGDKKAGSISS